MNFDIKQVPFSRYGSYISFSWLTDRFKHIDRKEGLYLRTVHGDARTKEILGESLREPAYT